MDEDEIIEPQVFSVADALAMVKRGEIRQLLINVPPRHMKSLLVAVFWAAWEWIRWPERRWLFSSFSAAMEPASW